jgi:hypothetical protein
MDDAKANQLLDQRATLSYFEVTTREILCKRMRKGDADDRGSPEDFVWKVHAGCADQVPAIVKLGTKSIGETHPSVETLGQRLAINPDVLQVSCRRYSDGKTELCGYSLLYPLTDEAGVAIARGEIRSGRDLCLEALMPTFSGARFLYIAMLFGTRDADVRSHVKTRLRDELVQRIRGGRVEWLYGRPASPPGLGLLKNHGFTAIGNGSKIWSVSSERIMRHLGPKVGDRL